MPVDDLPEMLKDILCTLLCKKSVNSWKIYDNNQGFVNVTITFHQKDIGDIESAAYRKLSQRQANRNRDRALNFQGRNSHNDNVPTGIQTRNMSRKLNSNGNNLEDKELQRSPNKCESSLDINAGLQLSPIDFSQSLNTTMHKISKQCPDKQMLGPPSPYDIPVRQETKPKSPEPIPEAKISGPFGHVLGFVPAAAHTGGAEAQVDVLQPSVSTPENDTPVPEPNAPAPEPNAPAPEPEPNAPEPNAPASELDLPEPAPEPDSPEPDVPDSEPDPDPHEPISQAKSLCRYADSIHISYGNIPYYTTNKCQICEEFICSACMYYHEKACRDAYSH